MIQTTDKYSDEMLNAYLDHELSSDERKRIMHDLRSDKTLQERLCQFEQVRNMVSIAYHDLTDPQKPERRQTHCFSARAAIASGIFILVGAMAGWTGHTYLQKDTSLVSLADQWQSSRAGSEQPWRVLLHVTSYDPYRLNTMLDEAERILHEYESKPQKVMIQVLANGKGLNLLRSDKTSYGKRIAALQAKYDNLVFMACARAMARVKQKTGKTVSLLPNIQITPAAIGEVLKKQRDGWTYIRI